MYVGLVLSLYHRGRSFKLSTFILLVCEYVHRYMKMPPVTPYLSRKNMHEFFKDKVYDLFIVPLTHYPF